MSWRVPDEDWESPWSFEEEWLKPSAKEIRRINASPEARAEENPLQSASAVTVPAGIRRGDEVVLRFDDDEPVEKPPVALSLPARKEKGQDKAVKKEAPSPPPFAPPAPVAECVPEPALTARSQSAPDPSSRAALPATEVSAAEPASAPVLADIGHVPFQPGRVPAVKPVTPTVTGLPPELPAKPATPRPYQLEPLPQALNLPSVVPVPAEDAGEIKAATGSKIPRLRRPSLFSWGTLISLGMGTLGFTLLAWIYLHDEPRESDEDLRPQVALDQTPTTQAPVKLRAFLDSIIPIDNVDLRRQAPWLWDTPSLAGFIRTNGTALDNLRDLLEDYDWHPHHAAWHQADLSTNAAWVHAVCLLQAQAAYLARRGDEAPALVAAMDLAELSRRLQEVWAWPGYMREALELQFASVKLLAELLKNTHLSGAELRRFQEEFSHCRPDSELMRQACAAYYVHEKKLLLGPASGELLDTMPGGQLHQRPGRLFFKMNETLGLFASAFRDLKDEINRPPYTRLSVSTAPSRTRLTSPRFYHPNSGGEAYFSARIEPLLLLPEDHSLAQARHGLVSCLFAIRRYLADKNALPIQLQSLVPDYLDAVPRDPFSGDAVFYEKESGVLYSVGVNLIPEGGRRTKVPLDDDREPTVELGIAIAQPVKR